MVNTIRNKRTDDLGRAFAGSQLQVQIYLARKRELLSRAVIQGLANVGKRAHAIRWVAPLEERCFREAADAEFLQALGLDRHVNELSAFWPHGGPNWDALGILGDSAAHDGVVLVEAKSYPDEVYGIGCQAKAKSRELIQHSLESTRAWFSCRSGADWSGSLYQYANRLAHIYFLRNIVGIDAWLVNLCFTGDSSTRSTTAEAWQEALPKFKTELGFSGDIPWVVDVILPGHPRSELVGPNRATG